MVLNQSLRLSWSCSVLLCAAAPCGPTDCDTRYSCSCILVASQQRAGSGVWEDAKCAFGQTGIIASNSVVGTKVGYLGTACVCGGKALWRILLCFGVDGA